MCPVVPRGQLGVCAGLALVCVPARSGVSRLLDVCQWSRTEAGPNVVSLCSSLSKCYLDVLIIVAPQVFAHFTIGVFIPPPPTFF